MMRGAGFRTAAFVNQIFLNTHQGFMQGFDEWCRPVSNTEVAWVNPHHPPPDEPLPDGTELGQVDGALVNAFIDWLGQAGDERLFVWLHLLRPHWPYLPPPGRMVDPPADWLDTMPPSDLYDIEIGVTDEDIGRVLDAIDEAVGLDRSVVIFTSDHGEAFGEHGGQEHGHSLHTEVTHVPLIVSAPDLARDRRVQTRVRTVDIVPTVLDLVSLEPDASGSLEGESLAPLVTGEGEDRPCYAAGMLYGGTERSLTRDGFRIMYDHDRGKQFFLYDIDKDPLELEDVADRHRDRLRSMREELRDRYMDYLRDFRETRETSHDPVAQEEEKENEKVLRAMKSLGYIK